MEQVASDFDTLDFFTDRAVVDNPHPYYEHIRARGPVHRHGHHNAVLVTGFEEGVQIYSDQEHYSSVNAANGPLPPLPFKPEGDDIGAQLEAHRSRLPLAGLLVTLDQPDHALLRAVVVQLFTPARLRALDQKIGAIADRLIDEFVDRGQVELARGFGVPFSGLVIADLLGVPEEDRAWFRDTFSTQPRLDQAKAKSARVETGEAAVSTTKGKPEEDNYNPLAFLDDKFTEYMVERRARPRDDILSEIANALLADGTRPTLEQVVTLATFLFGAGQDSTAKALTAAMRILAERPDLQNRIRADRTLIPEFVEESLRYDGPVKSSSRVVRKTVTLGGMVLPAGTHVSMLNGAMNRDPAKYEAPDEFRLGRPKLREHLAFGRGAHTCPGAQLARNEVRISIDRLLDRLADIRISEEHHGPPEARIYRQEPGYVLRGVKRLHLAFTPVKSG